MATVLSVVEIPVEVVEALVVAHVVEMATAVLEAVVTTHQFAM